MFKRTESPETIENLYKKINELERRIVTLEAENSAQKAAKCYMPPYNVIDEDIPHASKK